MVDITSDEDGFNHEDSSSCDDHRLDHFLINPKFNYSTHPSLSRYIAHNTRESDYIVNTSELQKETIPKYENCAILCAANTFSSFSIETLYYNHHFQIRIVEFYGEFQGKLVHAIDLTKVIMNSCNSGRFLKEYRHPDEKVVCHLPKFQMSQYLTNIGLSHFINSKLMMKSCNQDFRKWLIDNVRLSPLSYPPNYSFYSSPELHKHKLCFFSEYSKKKIR